MKPGPARGSLGELPAWVHASDGNTLFGIDAIAQYLALPFLDVRTMIEMKRLPIWKTGRANTSRRTDLAAHFLELERRQVPPVLHGAVPDDIGPDDSLGLLSGQHAVANYLGCSHGGVRYRRAHGLPLFWIGKTPFVRRASVDRWLASQAGETRSARRLATIECKRAASAPPGSLIGVPAIAAHLGRPQASVFTSIYRGQLPAFRVGRGWAADPAQLDAMPRKHRKETRHGERC